MQAGTHVDPAVNYEATAEHCAKQGFYEPMLVRASSAGGSDMSLIQKRKRAISASLTRGCGPGRHAWIREGEEYFDTDGSLHSATRWYCWVCSRFELRAPIGTFEYMMRLVAQPGMTIDEIGEAVERRFYPDHSHTTRTPS